MNKYFVDNPEMILGTIENKTTQFGLDTTCVPNDIPLQEQLSSAIENIHGEITDYKIEDIENDEQKFIIAELNVKNYSYTIIDDNIYYRENSKM